VLVAKGTNETDEGDDPEDDEDEVVETKGQWQKLAERVRVWLSCYENWYCF